MLWFSSKPKNFRGKNREGRYHANEDTWFYKVTCSYFVFSLCTSPALQTFLTNVWNLENHQCSSWVNKCKKKNSKKGTLYWLWFSNRSPTAGFHHDFTTITLYYLSLIISFFLYFSYKCIHSFFEIHSVFVTVTVATCSVYLKNFVNELPVIGSVL